MKKHALLSVILLLSTLFTCHAAKLGTTPSILQMQNGFLQIDVENVQKDVPFNIFAGWIGNSSYSTGKIFNGYLAAALIAENGEIKEIIHKEETTLHPGWGFGQDQMFYNMKITTDMADSDIVRFITLEDGQDEWLPVLSVDGYKDYSKVRDNEVMKSKVTVNIIGKNDISYMASCLGTRGESIQYDPVYSASYNIAIQWPAGKDHHFVSGGALSDGIQIDSDRILIQSVQNSEYTFTLMACSDDELIMEQRHFAVTMPGTLHELIRDEEERLYLNNISISGFINESDIYFIRDEMPMLEHLDLSEAKLLNDFLPDGAFEEKGLKSIILPMSIKKLGNNSLKDNDLYEIEIPSGVNYYGLNALNSNENLTLVVLHNPNVIPVSWCVLYGTNRNKGALFVPKGTKDNFTADSEWGQFGTIIEADDTNDWLSSESDGTYQYSGIYPNVTITEVINPSSVMKVPETVELKGRTYTVTNIGEQVFKSGIINEIYIPKSVIKLGKYAVVGSNLIKIEVDKNNPAYFSDGGVLYDRHTSTMLTYPSGKKESEYEVPEGVIEIGGWACYARYLKKIYFPSTLKIINDYAFCYSSICGDESIIVCKALYPPEIRQSAFNTDAINRLCKVYVPAASIDAYKEHPSWGLFKSINTIESTGVNGVETDNEDNIVVTGNTLIVNSGESFEIYGIDGRLVYNGTDNHITLNTGFYILRIGNKVIKIKI